MLGESMSHWNQSHGIVASSPGSGASITGTDGLARKLGNEPIENIDNHTVREFLDPLYMFYCGLQWRKHADSGAGWELIEALRLPERRLKAIAASMLARAEHGRLLMRDLERTRIGGFTIRQDS